MLGAFVVLATVGSFLVPWEWFFLVNPESTEINTLRMKQAALEDELSENQKVLHETEQVILLVRLEVEEREKGIVQLARRKVSVNEVHNPFRGGPPISSIIEQIMQERRDTDELGNSTFNSESSVASYFVEGINTALGQLDDYAVQQEAINIELNEYDFAQNNLNVTQSKYEQLKAQIASIEEEIDGVILHLHEITQQSINQYLAMRAVALGALGAFAAALAAFLRAAALDRHFPSGRTVLSMVFGGIVALVVFALFTTRELSVFVNDGATPDERPDYWRVVILCLIAGAFADRLFAAARERVEEVTRGRS